MREAVVRERGGEGVWCEGVVREAVVRERW